jgi:hypothetical protein
MFHDQGDKLATSTTDKAAIADMVAYPITLGLQSELKAALATGVS